MQGSGMCGIIGVLGTGPVAGSIVDALKRLEYRGYNSAGLATLENGKLARRRAEGKLKNLEAKLAAAPLAGAIGIGHTRWATHGKPTEINAHPHTSPRLAVVHNGIIENFRVLREELSAKGYVFETQTDSEIAAFVVEDELASGKDPAEAVHAALKRMRGAFALVYLFEGEDDLLIGARQGAPLAVGYGEGETYLGSDALALAPFTDRVAYLEEGDWVVARRSGAVIRDASGKTVERRIQRSPAGSLLAVKGNYRHFMDKEIHEQPEVVGHTLAHYVDMAAMRMKPFDWPVDPRSLSKVSIVACGTAYMAGTHWKILDRAVRPSAGRDRRRLRIPLPRDAGRPGRADDRHFAVRRDGGHAGVTEIRQGGRVEDGRRGQRAGLEHRASDRRRRADARRSGDRRRFDQGLYLPARGDGGARDQPRARPRNLGRGDGSRPPRRAGGDARPPGRGAQSSSRSPRSSPTPSPTPATCSSSGAARAIRWRWKAR